MADLPVPIETRGTGQEFEALAGPNHQSKNSKSSPPLSVTETHNHHDPEYRRQTKARIRNELDVYFAAVDNNRQGSFTIRRHSSDYPIFLSVAASVAIAFGAFAIEPTVDRALLSTTGWLTTWGVVFGISGWQQTRRRNQSVTTPTVRAVAQPEGGSRTTAPARYEPALNDKPIERPCREAVAVANEDAPRNETTLITASFAVLKSTTTSQRPVPFDASSPPESLIGVLNGIVGSTDCSGGRSGAERAVAVRSGSGGVSESGTKVRSERPEAAIGGPGQPLLESPEIVEGGAE